MLNWSCTQQVDSGLTYVHKKLIWYYLANSENVPLFNYKETSKHHKYSTAEDCQHLKPLISTTEKKTICLQNYFASLSVYPILPSQSGYLAPPDNTY